jgi:hypothetical protein
MPVKTSLPKKAGELIGKTIEVVEKKIEHFRGPFLRKIPDRLPHPDPKHGQSLDIPGYVQLDFFSCGAIAGWMVVEAIWPRSRFKDFYEACAPDPEYGLETEKLQRALRTARIGTELSDMLNFAAIKRNIDAGFPMIVCIDKPTEDDAAHWVVLYGYEEIPTTRGQKDRHVYLAGNDWRGLGIQDLTRRKRRPENRRIMPIRDFSRLNKGYPALVCWGLLPKNTTAKKRESRPAKCK